MCIMCALECTKKKIFLKKMYIKKKIVYNKNQKCVWSEHNPHEGRPWCYKNVKAFLSILRSWSPMLNPKYFTCKFIHPVNNIRIKYKWANNNS